MHILGKNPQKCKATLTPGMPGAYMSPMEKTQTTDKGQIQEDMTLKNENLELLQAFTAESVAAARYEVLALKAAKDGRPAEARLYRALYRALDIHARKALMILRGRAEDPSEDLQRTLAERRAAQDRAALACATATGASAGILGQLRDTAAGHATILKQFAEGVDEPLYVCKICGYIADKDVPGRCPVCNAVREKFEPVE